MVPVAPAAGDVINPHGGAVFHQAKGIVDFTLSYIRCNSCRGLSGLRESCGGDSHRGSTGGAPL